MDHPTRPQLNSIEPKVKSELYCLQFCILASGNSTGTKLTCERKCPEVEECLVTSPLEAPLSAKLDSAGNSSSAFCCSSGTAIDVAKEDPITAN